MQFQKFPLLLHPLNNNDGAIAQLVEQRTENPCVPGSIPGGTTDKERVTKVTLFSFIAVFSFLDRMFKPCLNRNLDMNTSVSLVHDTLKIGNHPLMLRVTQNRNNHRYP